MATKHDSPDGFRFSRRNFLKTTSVVGIAAETVVAPDEVAAQSGPPAMGPGDVQSAAGAHPYLVMVANNVGVGGKDLVAGQKFEAFPGEAGISGAVVPEPSGWQSTAG